MIVGVILFAAAGAQATAPPSSEAPGEIVVTGERTKRSLKDTPSSVAIITGAEIDAQAANRIDELLASIPNLQLGHGSEGPAIRGQDTTGALQALPAFLGGNRPRTTLVVDGRRTTYNEFVFGTAPVWDVNRIEVFRSPQTTTQGQNSIAGAIFVYSNDPTFEPEYRVRAIGGNFRTGELSAFASGPLSGDVALRVSGDVRYSRTTSRIADRIEGADPNHDVYGTGRAKLLVTPRGDSGARFELTYSHVQSQAPQVVGVTRPFTKRRDQSGFYGVFRINVDALTATAHQQLTDDLVTDVVVTGGDSNSRRLAFPGLGQSHIRGRDWSAEAVVNWSPEGPLRAVGGVSRSHLQLRQSIDLSVLSGIGEFRDAQDSAGIFGEGTLTILPAVTLTGGLRYQQDRQNRDGALGTGLSSIPLDYDRTFHAWLPKLSLAFDLTRDIRVGLLAERAYNPGGTTVRFDIGQPDNFEAERLWDYELFTRAKLAGGALTAEANLFYYDMRDAQRAKEIQIPSPSGFPVGFADLFNVPKARSYGLEASLDWRPSRRISAAIALGLLDTKILRAEGAYDEYQGKQFERSPHFTASAWIDWRPLQRLRLSAQMRHNAHYFSDDLNQASLGVKAFTIFDARAQWDTGKISLFAYAHNFFDKFYMAYVFDSDSGEAGDPRRVGVGIEARF